MRNKSIEAMVVECFGHAQAGAALEILERYGSSSHHVEVDRVHTVILRVAQGDIRKLSKLVDLALVDYRDVLVADEHVHDGVVLGWRVHAFVLALVVLLLFLLQKM